MELLSKNAMNQLGSTLTRHWTKSIANNGVVNSKNEMVYFYNFNLPAVDTCPNAPQACKGVCFAKRHEVRYKAVKDKRNINYNDTLKYDFVNKMINEIEDEYRKKIKNKKKINGNKLQMNIRIHGSGDYYNDTYFEKWLQITDAFRENTSIHFMSYTKEIIMIYNYLNKNNLSLDDINIKLVFSSMEGYGIENDTSQEDIKTLNKFNQKTNSNAIDIYTVVPSGYFSNNSSICKMSANSQFNNVKDWKTNHYTNKYDEAKKPEFIDDYVINKNAPICLNCMRCYMKSSGPRKTVMIEF